jgi:hypothetical protein
LLALELALSTFPSLVNAVKQATSLSLFIFSVLQTEAYPILARREGGVGSLVTTAKKKQGLLHVLLFPDFLPDALQ